MNKRKGFTLMELVVVIAILAVLGLLLYPQITNYLNNAKDAVDKANVVTLNKNTAMYSVEHPNNTNDIFSGLGSDDARQQALVDDGYLKEIVKPTKEGNQILWDVAQQLWVLKLGNGGSAFSKDGTILDQRENAKEYNNEQNHSYGDVYMIKDASNNVRYIKCVSKSGCNGTPPTSPTLDNKSSWKEVTLNYYRYNNYEKGDIIEHNGSYYRYTNDGTLPTDYKEPGDSKDFEKVTSDGNGGWN